MKVALVIDTWFPFIGGGQINTYQISRRLAKTGVEIDIITRDCGQYFLKLPKNLRVFKLGPKSQPGNLISIIAFLVRSFFFILRRDYDLVHAHAFLPGITAKLLAHIKGIPSIFTVHGTSLGTKLNNPLKRFIERFILTSIAYNAQITVSQDFLKINNVNRNINYIPNGVDIDDFDKVTVAKQTWPTLIFVGRLHKQKNLVNLLKATSAVSQDLPDVRLQIVGDGPEKTRLVRIVTQLKLERSVKFLGEVTGRDLIKLYKSSQLFILPSIYEGQPLTLLEAWAAKLPVATTKTGDCQYLVKDGVNGYLIASPGDYQAIATIIKKALNNKKLPTLGESGYNLVKKKFSWDQSADLTYQLYKKLISV